MNLINDLLEKPSSLTTASRYTAFNGVVYLIAGATLIIWPGVLQTLFREEAFRGPRRRAHARDRSDDCRDRVLYVFGGRSGARQIVAASVIDRLVFVPLVLLPLAIAGVFPRLFVAFTILDASLAIGAWWLIHRK